MASIESIRDSVYEAVLRSAREKEKSYDEAVKDFLEFYDELLLNRKKEVFDWAVANMHVNAESLEKSYDQDVEAYLKARGKKNKNEPKKLLDWIGTNARMRAEDKKKLEDQKIFPTPTSV